MPPAANEPRTASSACRKVLGTPKTLSQMNFGALPEGKVGLGIPHGAPPPLVWGTQIIQEFNEGLVLGPVFQEGS